MSMHDAAHIPVQIVGIRRLFHDWCAPEAFIAETGPRAMGKRLNGKGPDGSASGEGRINIKLQNELVHRLEKNRAEGEQRKQKLDRENCHRRKKTETKNAGADHEQHGERHQCRSGFRSGLRNEKQCRNRNQKTAYAPAAPPQIDTGKGKSGHDRSGNVLVREDTAPEIGVLRLQSVGAVCPEIWQEEDARIGNDNHDRSHRDQHRRIGIAILRQAQNSDDGQNADHRQKHAAHGG